MKKNDQARVLWWVLVAGGLLCLAYQGRANAGERPPRTRVGYVCVAGLAVRMITDETYGEGHLLGGVSEYELCRLPMVPEGLPGQHLMSSTLEDMSGGITVVRQKESPREALENTVAWLGRQGWEEGEASGLARTRDPSIQMVAMERKGGHLYVVGVPDPGGDGGLVVAAGIFDEGGAR